MKTKMKYFKYLTLFILLSFILFLGYQYFKNKKTFNYQKKFEEDATPVPTTDWLSYSSSYGFSFMHPINFEIKENNKSLAVGEIIIKIEILNCENPIPLKKITNEIKFYGFPAEINETEKTAYLCNNTNTACLDISKEKEKTKITEGFFHSFISSLNIRKDFDKISCLK
jgi:hypothetical protein